MTGIKVYMHHTNLVCIILTISIIYIMSRLNTIERMLFAIQTQVSKNKEQNTVSVTDTDTQTD